MQKAKWVLMLIVAWVSSTAYAQITMPELPLKSYVLMDAATGQILAEKNLDEKLPPASITKLMTAYVVFEALKNGKIHLNDMVTISENAYRQEGSRMFVELNSQVSVENLLKGMIIQSGNDSAVALAEYIAGTTDGFVQLMNQQAEKLGLKNTHYLDVNGLPMPEHHTTAYDIALLDRAIIQQFPEYYPYFSEKSFTWNKITQSNRNKLLWRDSSVDGLKTGHTQDAGYCLTVSAKRGDIRLIAVVLGAEKESIRNDAVQQLINFGFSQFSLVRPISIDKVLATPPVFKGEADSVEVIAEKPVSFLMENTEQSKLQASLSLKKPLIAPISKGEAVGTITLKVGDKVYATVPVLAKNGVAKGGFIKRMTDNVKLWWDGK